MTTRAMREHDYKFTKDQRDRYLLGYQERLCTKCNALVLFHVFADREAVHHPSNPQGYCPTLHAIEQPEVITVIAMRLIAEGADQHERYYGPLSRTTNPFRGARP